MHVCRSAKAPKTNTRTWPRGGQPSSRTSPRRAIGHSCEQTTHNLYVALTWLRQVRRTPGAARRPGQAAAPSRAGRGPGAEHCAPDRVRDPAKRVQRDAAAGPGAPKGAGHAHGQGAGAEDRLLLVRGAHVPLRRPARSPNTRSSRTWGAGSRGIHCPKGTGPGVSIVLEAQLGYPSVRR